MTGEIVGDARRPSFKRAVRLSVATVAITLAVGVIPTASASTGSELEAARSRLAAIEHEVEQTLAFVRALEARTERLAEEIYAAEARIEETESNLAGIRARIREAERRYEEARDRFDQRAVEMFTGGGGSSFAFVLDASSMTDFMDRLEFTSALADADAELATTMTNLANTLDMERKDVAGLLTQQREARAALQERSEELQRQFEEQQAAYQRIADRRAEAEEIVSKVKAKYQRELAAIVPSATVGGGGTVSGPNPFSFCPVGDPHALTDSFGAPRYGGGYHLHAGNDIMAPEGTPIYATFAGVASDSSNGLGGLAVTVVGAAGSTYNAHMVRIGQLGSVSAGDVIGYVGATGDTSTPHNHFEWRPNTLPSSWPASAYGYSIVGDAVNPYPLLTAVC
jgi:murein DD-endopeptidase MepM/ murein hydrolase activator NlpD